MSVKKTDSGYIKVIILIFGLLLFWAYTFKNLPSGTDLPTIEGPTEIIGTTGDTCQKGDPNIQIEGPTFKFSEIKGGRIKGDEEPPTWSLSNRRYKLIVSNILIKAGEFGTHHIYSTTAKGDSDIGKPTTTVVDSSNNPYLFYALAGDRKNPDPGCKAAPNSDKNCKVFYPELDLALLVRLDKGQPITAGPKLTGNKNKDKSSFLAADIYQSLDSTEEVKDWMIDCKYSEKGKLIGLTIAGTGVTTSTTSTTEFVLQDPSKKSPDQKELQLETFYLQKKTIKTQGPSQGAFFDIGCKPAIYLYPSKETNVKVKVNTKGSLTYTDPEYPSGGWNTIAYPNGDIFVDNNKYPYLYYESKIPDGLINIPKQGYTVEFSKLNDLYDILLPSLGLDPQQTKDFKEYWLKTLPFSPYYFVGIMNKEDIEAIEPLEITPKPNSVNRVRLYFKALEKKPQITDTPILPDLPSDLQHQTSGFRVLEWGGMFKPDPFHPFSCSQ